MFVIHGMEKSILVRFRHVTHKKIVRAKLCMCFCGGYPIILIEVGKDEEKINKDER